MLNWFQALLPKEDRFFDLFDAQAETLVKGAEGLRRALDGGAGTAAACADVVKFEHEADRIAAEVTLGVRRSFITPFDRSDIRGLSNSLDDAIDQMQKTVKAIGLFEVTEFKPEMRELGDLTIEASRLTVEAVALLPQMRKQSARLNILTEKISKIEDTSDAVYDRGLRALYAEHRTGNAMPFVIGSEIYDHLEKVVDRFEDVADRISGIVVEHL